MSRVPAAARSPPSARIPSFAIEGLAVAAKLPRFFVALPLSGIWYVISPDLRFESLSGLIIWEFVPAPYPRGDLNLIVGELGGPSLLVRVECSRPSFQGGLTADAPDGAARPEQSATFRRASTRHAAQ
jgi:hypothetical protein